MTPARIRGEIEALEASKIRAIARIGMTMPGVIPLWFGESDLPTPAAIKDAAVASLANNETLYAPNPGIPALRDAIGAYLSRLYRRSVSPDRVTVTASGMNAIMMTMQALVGTSGFAYKPWKGPFYPADLKDEQMLTFYGQHFRTVEINNTFYKMPTEEMLTKWASQVPESFSFAIKASQRITHYARLKPDSASALEFLLRNTSTLGSRLGPILFQLPPNMQKNVERLTGFLALLPRDRRFTIEFRHESWFDDDVFTALRDHDIALCVSESEEFTGVNVATASWGYLRLHRQDYTDEMLAEWRSRVAAQSWTDAYVFFKHDYIDGSGPLAVERFVGMVGAGSSGVSAAEAHFPSGAAVPARA